MTKEEAEKYADNMTYRDAIYNLMKARSIPYRKATFIKINKLLKALEQEPCEDCISRQAVIEHICEGKDCYKKNCKGILYNRCPDIEWVNELPPITPQYTDAEIQKMQEMEQAEIQKAYELGKEDKQAGEEAKTFNVLQFVADNAGLSTFEAIEKAYNMGVSEQKLVFNKVRAEVLNLDDINPDYPMDRTIHISRNEVLEIIDKYKAESEEQICTNQ